MNRQNLTKLINKGCNVSTQLKSSSKANISKANVSFALHETKEDVPLSAVFFPFFPVCFAFFVNNVQTFDDAEKGSGEKKRYNTQNLNFNTGKLIK